jgi:hypothetical protein
MNGSLSINNNNIVTDNILSLWRDNNINTDPTFFFGLGINAAVLRYQVPITSSHVFYSGSAELLRISNNRDVSMNKLLLGSDASMNGKLFVQGDVSMNGIVSVPTQVNTDNSTRAATTAFVTNKLSAFSTSNFTTDVSMNRRLLVLGDVTTTGNVAINKTSITSGFALDVSGNITTTSLTTTSDYRIKTNIQTLDGTFTVDNLRPVSYYNTLANNQDIGVIAHELQQHYPFLVHGNKDDDDYQSVNYTGLIGVLINEIQQLKKRVTELENKQ